MANAVNLQFPTESSYEGAYKDALKCMDGFGCYQYPDKSVYYGYFKRGLFHGFGELQLAAPYNFVIKGYFENGKLNKIETMFFDDGLHVKVKPSTKLKNQLDFSDWSYCCQEDRRFPAEVLNGLRAVGPNAMITKNSVARPLDIGEYDTEQGIYHKKSGFMYMRSKPYKESTYMPCPDEVNWITENCRRGSTAGDEREPKPEICKKVITSNIVCQNFTDRKYGAIANKNPGHKYFAKLYETEMKAAKKAYLGEREICAEKSFPKRVKSFGSLFADKTESHSSFPVMKLRDPAIERLACENQFKPSDLSLSMNMSLMNIKHTRFN